MKLLTRPLSLFLIILLIITTASLFVYLSRISFLGIPLGGDWSFPASVFQAKKLAEIARNAWGNANFLWGFNQITLFPAVLFIEIILIGWKLYGNGPQIWATICIFMICLSCVGIHLLVREFGGTRQGSVAACILFTLSALTFDYFVMGWIYALVALSLLPLCLWAFIRGLGENRVMLLLSGTIFALSPIQSQAMIWYFLCFLVVAVTYFSSQPNPWRAAKALAVVLLIFALGNAYWLPGLFLYPPSYVASSDIVSSAVSLGIMGHYRPLNTLRIWGSLFNFQFETIQISAGLAVFSFLAPVLAIIGLLTTRSPYKWGFVLLMLSPVMLMGLGNNRGLLAAIPFANTFRDVPRFSMLTLLGTSVLAGLGAGSIFQWAAAHWGRLGQACVATFLAIVLAGATYPWWSGEMTNWQATKGPDIRLRFKEFPESYFRLESRLAEERLLQKAMYYPLGGTVSFRDDPRFTGAFQETADFFSGLSPVPGIAVISDRKFGAIDALMERLAHDEPDRAQLKMLAESGVRLFIFRRNLLGPYPSPNASLVHEMVVVSGDWMPWFEDREVVAYATREFKPLVYTVPVRKDDANDDAPTVEFRKIDPTLYRVRIHDMSEPFILVFNETHNIHWRIALAPSPPGSKSAVHSGLPWASADGAATREDLRSYVKKGILTLPDALMARQGRADQHQLRFISQRNQGTIQNDNLPDLSLRELLAAPTVINFQHIIANGFANGWIIDPANVCSQSLSCQSDTSGNHTIDFLLEFVPQRVFYIGGMVTLATYSLLLLYGLYLLIPIKLKAKITQH